MTTIPEGSQVKIDPKNAQYTQLGHVFGPVNRGSTPDGKEYDALAVPDDVDGRTQLLSRLLELTGNSSDSQVFAAIKTSLEAAMPNPEKDPKGFVLAVRGKCHGTLEMLRLLVSFQGKAVQGQRPEVISAGKQLGADEPVDGMPTPLKALTGDVREKVIHVRVEALKRAIEIRKLKNTNTALYAQVLAKFKKLSESIQQAASIFASKIDTMTEGDEYRKVQWYNAMLNNINLLDAKTAPMALQNLKMRLEQAKDAQEFTAAIDGLTQVVVEETPDQKDGGAKDKSIDQLDGGSYSPDGGGETIGMEGMDVNIPDGGSPSDAGNDGLDGGTPDGGNDSQDGGN